MLSVSDCVVLTSIRRGLNPLVNYPCIPGHEIGGTVLATGDMAGAIAVTGWSFCLALSVACAAPV